MERVKKDARNARSCMPMAHLEQGAMHSQRNLHRMMLTHNLENTDIPGTFHIKHCWQLMMLLHGQPVAEGGRSMTTQAVVCRVPSMSTCLGANCHCATNTFSVALHPPVSGDARARPDGIERNLEGDQNKSEDAGMIMEIRRSQTLSAARTC
jgi:hypothetical protein